MNEDRPRMQMKRKTAKEHNKMIGRVGKKSNNMSPTEWNRHLDELKRLGKYNGEKYAHTRSRLDEIFEINEDMKAYNRGE